MVSIYYITTLIIQSPQDLAGMRIAGQQAAQLLEYIEPFVVPGVSTEHLNTLCHDYITQQLQAIPAPLNYRGFPKSICTSVNQVVCHGVPDAQKTLKKGDIINIDVTLIQGGYHGDTSKMYCVGEVTGFAKKLCTVTQQALYAAIKLVKPGIHLGDIGHCIQTIAQAHGYSVVREYCGHGIGKEFHESPEVLHYGKAGTGEILVVGQTFTIEPMINIGTWKTRLLQDEWTVLTKDNKLSAQWEHTVTITSNGVEVLTLRAEEHAALADIQ